MLFIYLGYNFDGVGMTLAGGTGQDHQRLLGACHDLILLLGLGRRNIEDC